MECLQIGLVGVLGRSALHKPPEGDSHIGSALFPSGNTRLMTGPEAGLMSYAAKRAKDRIGSWEISCLAVSLRERDGPHREGEEPSPMMHGSRALS